MSILAPDPVTTNWVPLGYGATIQSNVPACHVTRAADFSVPNSVQTAIPFDVERYDTDNIHDNVTNNTRLTCRTAGKYLIVATITFLANATNTRQIGLQINGASNIALRAEIGQVNNTSLIVSAVWDLVVGDYIEAIAFQNSGSALNVQFAAQHSPNLSMTYIGPGLLGRGQQNIQGTLAARPAANTVPAGTTYFASDVGGLFLSDGTQWLLSMQRAFQVAPGQMSLAPWTSPYDGMELLLVDSGANPTYEFRLRYNSASSNTQKWEFIGGSPAEIRFDAGSNTTSGVGVSLGGPSFTIPRTGYYRVEFGYQCVNNAAGAANSQMSVSRSGTALASVASGFMNVGAAGYVATGSRSVTLGVLNQNDVLDTLYSSSNGISVQFSSRWMRVTPQLVQ